MTNLSDAADILKRASTEQAETVGKPMTFNSMAADHKPGMTITSADVAPPPVYSLQARSGKVVKMTGDDKDIYPGMTTIAE